MYVIFNLQKTQVTLVKCINISLIIRPMVHPVLLKAVGMPPK